MKEKIIKIIPLYKGKILNLDRLIIEAPNGNLAFREVVTHKAGVCIIPVQDDYIFFIKQHRIAVDQEIIELPAGMVEENENLEDAALRELAEEIKYSSKSLKYLGSYYCTPGCMTEKTSIFLADNLFPSYKKEDDNEDIQIIKMKLSDAKRMLENNEFNDMKTALGVSLYLNNIK